MLVHPDFRKDATMGNKMKIVSNTLDFELDTDTAVAIGKFDGLHKRHDALIEKGVYPGIHGIDHEIKY